MPRAARSRSTTTTAFARLTREAIETRAAKLCGAIASCCRSPASRAPASIQASRRSCAADRLAERLGVSELYIKDDSVNHPTLSYKDRVVSVAATRAVELGFKVLGVRVDRQPRQQRRRRTPRASASSAASSSRTTSKPARCSARRSSARTILAIAGNYDDVNRLCTQMADRYGWGFANINLRCYYAEGAKTMGFEIVEQLGWRYPAAPRVAGRRRHAAAAHRSAGSASCARSGWSKASCRASTRRRPPGARRSCARSRRAWNFPEPVRPTTIAKSIAIGNPADGYQVIEAVKSTGGSGAASTDEEILHAMQLLAETEGIFTEPAGGTTLAGAIAARAPRRDPADESVVVCITGNGYKTAAETIASRVAPARIEIGRSLADFEAYLQSAPEKTAALPNA